MTQRLSAQAFGLCKTEEFQRFVDRKRGVPDKFTDADSAAQWLREQCGITSRGQLDTDFECGKKFEAIVREYRQWVAAREACA